MQKFEDREQLIIPDMLKSASLTNKLTKSNSLTIKIVSLGQRITYIE